MTDSLTVAVPKGRVLEQLVPRLQRAGLNTDALTAKSRQLIREDRATGLRYLLLKPDDVPTYVEYGAADLGIVGRDVLLERDYDLYAPIDLEIGVCKVAVAGLPDAPYPPPAGRTLRVATKFARIATEHFRQYAFPVEIIYAGGSVELAPLTGLADVIVDIVETGETLRQNGLVVLEDVVPISSLVVVNRAQLKLKQERLRPLLAALK